MTALCFERGMRNGRQRLCRLRIMRSNALRTHSLSTESGSSAKRLRMQPPGNS